MEPVAAVESFEQPHHLVLLPLDDKPQRLLNESRLREPAVEEEGIDVHVDQGTWAASRHS